MNKRMKSLLLVLLLAAGATTAALAQTSDWGVTQPGTDKLAQTGFKFLTVNLDPRSAAMADAGTADMTAAATSIFRNPASMASLTGLNFGASNLSYIADINYNGASLAWAPMGGRFGVVGLSMMMVDYGEIDATMVSDDPNNPSGFVRYSELGLANPTPTATAFGLAYARQLSDRFAVGGHLKYVGTNFDEGIIKKLTEADGGGFMMRDNNINTFAFDFGLLYRTGWKSLNFAMTAQNFAPEIKYYEENFEIPLLFRMGVSMDLMDFTTIDKNVHSLLLNVSAERPRDFAENIRVGAEYTIMNTLSLRAGYSYPATEQTVNLGAGVKTNISGFGIGADYAYSEFGIFGRVNRMAVNLSF